MTSLRTIALAAALGLMTGGTASASTPWPQLSLTASASDWAADAEGLQTGRSVYEDVQEHPMDHYRRLHHAKRHDRIHANGYCNGRASGTGDNSCGTATGGPVGGNPSRN